MFFIDYSKYGVVPEKILWVRHQIYFIEKIRLN